jgi:uncharacterized protein YbjT (DUF2867 family)
MTTLLLAGATGLVGRETLALLLADDRVTQVVAPTRRSLAPHLKLLNPVMDSSTMPVDADWWSVDGAISAIGTTRAQSPSASDYRAIDYDYALAIAARVRKGGASRFALISSMGADARSWFRYTRTKGELEDAVAGLGFNSLTIIRPGFLGGIRSEARQLERITGAMLRLATPVLPAIARISPAVTVAALLVEAAINGQAGTHVISSGQIATIAAQKHR